MRPPACQYGWRGDLIREGKKDDNGSFDDVAGTDPLMAAQSIEQLDGSTAPAFAGVWAIFGHGNVAGLGEALYGVRDGCRHIAAITSRAWRISLSPMPNRCSGAG